MDVGALTEANALSFSAAEVLTGESNCKLQKWHGEALVSVASDPE